MVGFNSGKYDLNLIKKYFVTHVGGEKTVTVAKKQEKIMFLTTPNFKFFDIINYLGPGTSYEKRVKTYGSGQTKSSFPYEWCDSSDKLDYEGLPPYRCWFSKLKNAFVLSPEEFEDCQHIFQERGMKTFADWLRYYNNLDVGPFLEALETMRGFYANLDIFKDAVSLPGVSLKYLLRGTLGERNAPELYTPEREAYDMLKDAVVGCPSLVFTRKHEAGKTKIRSHKYEDVRLCQRVLGYDANALYPSTMLQEMPCGKEKIVVYPYPSEAVAEFGNRLKTKQWFGFAEGDISVPNELWDKIEEFPPLFQNNVVTNKAIPEHMKKYLRKTNRTVIPGQKKLLGLLSANTILLYAPRFEWYLDHGLKITAVYRTIDYKLQKIFPWFFQQVTEYGREGVSDPGKALLAEVFKLLGNSVYAKLIEAVERQTRVIYTKDQGKVDRAKRSVWFDDMKEIGDAFEIEFRKEKVTMNRPFQIGIVVYLVG